jgi:hypothetical protein
MPLALFPATTIPEAIPTEGILLLWAAALLALKNRVAEVSMAIKALKNRVVKSDIAFL